MPLPLAARNSLVTKRNFCPRIVFHRVGKANIFHSRAVCYTHVSGSVSYVLPKWTETAFDPHFQHRGTLSHPAAEAGLTLTDKFGNRMSFTLNFQKPITGEQEDEYKRLQA